MHRTARSRTRRGPYRGSIGLLVAATLALTGAETPARSGGAERVLLQDMRTNIAEGTLVVDVLTVCPTNPEGVVPQMEFTADIEQPTPTGLAIATLVMPMAPCQPGRTVEEIALTPLRGRFVPDVDRVAYEPDVRISWRVCFPPDGSADSQADQGCVRLDVGGLNWNILVDVPRHPFPEHLSLGSETTVPGAPPSRR